MQLKTRLRRLRQSPQFLDIFKETSLSPKNLIMPYFVREGKNIKKEISSMPGIYQFSLDKLVKEIREDYSLGIPGIILFGIPDKKDEAGSEAFNANGIIQRAVKLIKDKIPNMLVITDVCLCEYMTHGHCGIVKRVKASPRGASSRGDSARGNSARGGKGFAPRGLSPRGLRVKGKTESLPALPFTPYPLPYFIDNDETLEILAKIAVSQAQAGADIVAPSAMMDGQVKAIRTTLDSNNLKNTPIMAYSAKFASSFYAPFRDAAESPPQFGDRKSYQMNFSNSKEAMREIEEDIKEGADIIMVKPALPYLDIVSKAKDRINAPIAAYNVSGEYAMVKAAINAGYLPHDKTIVEILTSIKRAGADIILSYHAKEAAKILNG